MNRIIINHATLDFFGKSQNKTYFLKKSLDNKVLAFELEVGILHCEYVLTNYLAIQTFYMICSSKKYLVQIRENFIG